MKKINLIFILISAMTLQAQSQIDSASFLDKTTFKIGYYGYFGNLFINNGSNVGAEYSWKEKEKVKEKKRGQKTIRKQLLFHANIGYSSNFTTQTDNGLSAYAGIIWRKTGPKRWQFNLELNPLGYYRSFLPEAYEIQGDEVSKVGFPGRNYYSPSISFGIGRQRKRKELAGWYLNFSYNSRMPYNAGALPTFYLQYGHHFNFKKNK